VLGVGKIEDIFCGRGLTHAVHTQDNAHGLTLTTQILQQEADWSPWATDLLPQTTMERQLIFVNLVETDMNYGHRRDVEGYARCLETIDAAIGSFLPAMGAGDLLMITGDHGCDPTAPGSDHTREYAPLLMYSPAMAGYPVGTRLSFADLGQTALDWLHLKTPHLPGSSMLVAATR
jgi:phosphopentomutase